MGPCGIFRRVFPVVLLFLALAGECVALRDATGPDRSDGPRVVKSYLGNYVITGPDIGTAADYAKHAEDVRKLVAELLGDDGIYRIPAYITVSYARNEIAGRIECRVRLTHGGLTSDSGVILKNRAEQAVRFYVVYCYLLDVAAVQATANGKKIRGDQVPLWICAAIMENLTKEGREAHRDFMLASLAQGKRIPLEQLFGRKGGFENEHERAFYFHECGSVLEYLLSLPLGREKVLQSLRDLWRRDDFTISLMWQFRTDFASMKQLEEKWAEFTQERPEKFFDFKRLTVAETRKRLAAILTVEITSVDDKTIKEKTEVTDFAGLMKHEDGTARVNIAISKITELHDLKLRAPKEYQEVLSEYILSLRAIAGSEKRTFRKHYRKANKLLAGL